MNGQLQSFIKRIRESHARQIEGVDAIVKDLAEHHQEAVSQAAHAEVRRQLATFLDALTHCPRRGNPCTWPCSARCEASTTAPYRRPWRGTATGII